MYDRQYSWQICFGLIWHLYMWWCWQLWHSQWILSHWHTDQTMVIEMYFMQYKLLLMTDLTHMVCNELVPTVFTLDNQTATSIRQWHTCTLYNTSTQPTIDRRTVTCCILYVISNVLPSKWLYLLSSNIWDFVLWQLCWFVVKYFSMIKSSPFCCVGRKWNINVLLFHEYYDVSCIHVY